MLSSGESYKTGMSAVGIVDIPVAFYLPINNSCFQYVLETCFLVFKFSDFQIFKNARTLGIRESRMIECVID